MPDSRYGSERPQTRRAPLSATTRANSAARVDLPTPAGPKTETRWGSWSSAARAHSVARIASSDERPTIACADQRPLARDGDRATGDPRGHGAFLALGDHRLGRDVLDAAARRQVRLFADDDAVDRRRRLQARGGVHHVARDHRLAELRPRAEGHDRLAGVDGDPDLQVARQLERRCPRTTSAARTARSASSP